MVRALEYVTANRVPGVFNVAGGASCRGARWPPSAGPTSCPSRRSAAAGSRAARAPRRGRLPPGDGGLAPLRPRGQHVATRSKPDSSTGTPAPGPSRASPGPTTCDGPRLPSGAGYRYKRTSSSSSVTPPQWSGESTAEAATIRAATPPAPGRRRPRVGVGSRTPSTWEPFRRDQPSGDHPGPRLPGSGAPSGAAGRRGGHPAGGTGPERHRVRHAPTAAAHCGPCLRASARSGGGRWPSCWSSRWASSPSPGSSAQAPLLLTPRRERPLRVHPADRPAHELPPRPGEDGQHPAGGRHPEGHLPAARRRQPRARAGQTQL